MASRYACCNIADLLIPVATALGDDPVPDLLTVSDLKSLGKLGDTVVLKSALAAAEPLALPISRGLDI